VTTFQTRRAASPRTLAACVSTVACSSSSRLLPVWRLLRRALCFAADTPPAPAKPWKIQRLSWAGIRIEGNASSLFIDPWISAEALDGSWKRPIIKPEASSARRAVLVTHLHNDHFDPPAVKAIVGDNGSVICVDTMATPVASRGFRVRAVPQFQPEAWADFVVLPLPAVDGFGDSQVSWMVIAGERRIIHCGDTLWHSHFDLYGRAYGPFDYAFLPVNGAVVDPQPPRTGIARTLTPRHAVAAAQLLRARTLVPIHYGLSDAEYHEHPNALGELRAAAAEASVDVRIVDEGEWL
jgi:L-ascorbate metabolism protein UlaG (beta-lactamase superfamily)